MGWFGRALGSVTLVAMGAAGLQVAAVTPALAASTGCEGTEYNVQTTGAGMTSVTGISHYAAGDQLVVELHNNGAPGAMDGATLRIQASNGADIQGTYTQGATPSSIDYTIPASGNYSLTYTVADVPAGTPWAFETFCLPARGTIFFNTPSSATSSDTVPVTWTFDPDPPGDFTTGTVTFALDGTASSAALALAGGTIAYTYPAMPPGTHTLTATYSGDANYDGGSYNQPIIITTATGTTLSSSHNPANEGDAVTFTATVSDTGSGTTPTGDVEFYDGATLLDTAALAGSTATLQVSNLTAGNHSITAKFVGGNGYLTSTSTVLTQTVLALGQVTINIETDGTDAVFGFSSPTPRLNVSVPTTGGSGQSAAIELPTGNYTITADDMAGAGFTLTDLTCSDGDSSGNVASRTASIALAPGEALSCTFTSINSREATTALIEDFLLTRGSLILENQPDLQRRIGRLNGEGSNGDMLSGLMNYATGGERATLSTSLSAIDRLAGNEKQQLFDVWFEGTFARLTGDQPEGSFGVASVGADYLVNPDLLVGAFLQADMLSQSTDDNAIRGKGWMAGPYLTARLGENIYFDLLAGAGTSRNEVSPYNTYTDSFDASRWMVSAALQGEWAFGQLTFAPRLRASYFEETSEAYTDGLGIDIPEVMAGVGQIAVGPGLGYRLNAGEEVELDLGLRLDAVAEYRNTADAAGFDNAHGRIEGNADWTFGGGTRVGVSLSYDGIGRDQGAAGGELRVSAPLD